MADPAPAAADADPFGEDLGFTAGDAPFAKLASFTADDDDEEYIHQASDGDGACPTLFLPERTSSSPRTLTANTPCGAGRGRGGRSEAKEPKEEG